MKMLVATLALVTAIASPALAQTQTQALAQAQTKVRHAGAHSASVQAQARVQRHSDNPANDVYDGAGKYIGSDPDPLVRFDLLRDDENNY